MVCWLIYTSVLISIKILILHHTYTFTITFIFFILFTEASLWQYIQSCCNIYYLPLILFNILKNETNRYNFGILIDKHLVLRGVENEIIKNLDTNTHGSDTTYQKRYIVLIDCTNLNDVLHTYDKSA